MRREGLGDDSESGPELAKEIMEYFLGNPQAADSLEGIARWRLLEQVIRIHVENTERALQWLVGKGYLIEAETASSGPTFRLNEDKKAEALDYLSRGRTMQVKES
jgi:hypothetical protein